MLVSASRTSKQGQSSMSLPLFAGCEGELALQLMTEALDQAT
jgi:hypothetical protein